MAYISNILPKYGGSYISAPGSKINQSKGTSAVFGIPTSNSAPAINFSTANSTKQTAMPASPITRSGGTKSGTSAPVKATGSTATSVAAPTTTQPTTQPKQDYTGLITGLTGLRDSLQSYKDNISPVQPPTPVQPKKGLLDAPKMEEKSQFSQFLGGLMGASKPNDMQNKYLALLEQAALKNQQIADDARATSGIYGNEIARVGKLGAGAVAGAKSTGTDVVGRGNANIAAEAASNRMNALSAGLAAELQGTQQQLTGANQEASAFNNAVTGVNTQQQLGINALNAGATLAAPSPAQYGQTVFDPTTGQYSGGNLDPQVQANNLAQQVMSGNMTYDQALASLGYAGNAGTNFLNNALTGAGANPLQLQAQNAAQQANIATQGTAGTEIARQGLAQTTQDYVAMTGAAQFAGQQAHAVSNILERTGLNNISSTDYNKALNKLKTRFSDTDFAALNTALTESQMAYRQLLSTAGGTPTANDEAAMATLNINQSASAIAASIRELESAVARRLQSKYGELQQFNTNLSSGNMMGGTTSNTSGGSSMWDW